MSSFWFSTSLSSSFDKECDNVKVDGGSGGMAVYVTV
jgi:hypothetical protein